MIECVVCLLLLREITIAHASACQSEQCAASMGALQVEEAEAERYLTGELESAQNRMCTDIATALWNYDAEPSQLAARDLAGTLQHYSNHADEVWTNVTRFNWTSFTNSTLRRAFRKLSFIGKRALDVETLAKHVPSFEDLRRILSLSENSAERLHYFQQWMKQTRRFGEAFSEILQITGAESKLNGNDHG
ncbi:hypothetical protein HPB50_023282 [Hyalomma asiaticum]|uniref:Uncharacterized protein n=1 Tax=Hyalomma asiaticum TaxID=266040 RepID=A0ACB7S8J3_HYAAI|nr:hypothetical protein HPB50_023282 [Hyalomma asiaticum]